MLRQPHVGSKKNMQFARGKWKKHVWTVSKFSNEHEQKIVRSLRLDLDQKTDGDAMEMVDISEKLWGFNWKSHVDIQSWQVQWQCVLKLFLYGCYTWLKWVSDVIRQRLRHSDIAIHNSWLQWRVSWPSRRLALQKGSLGGSTQPWRQNNLATLNNMFDSRNWPVS